MYHFFLFCGDDEVLEVSRDRKKKSKMLGLLLSQVSKKNTHYFCSLYIFQVHYLLKICRWD